MHPRLPPYLHILRKELRSTLAPARDDAGARQAALYVDRMLVQLLVQGNVLPRLQQEAMRSIDSLLDELCAAVRGIDGGIVLASELTHYLRVRPDFDALSATLDATVRTLLAAPDAASTRLVRRIADVMRAVHEGLDHAARELERAPGDARAQAAPPLDDAQVRRLRQWLVRTFPDAPQLDIGSVTQLAGGGSKKTLRIALRHAGGLPDAVVVRADDASGVLQSTVVDEYAILRVAHAAGVPAPRPLAMETDVAVIGAPFILVDHVPGRNIGDHVECYEPGAPFALSLARALGRLHAIPPERFGANVPGAQLATTALVRARIDATERSWRNAGRPVVAMEMAFDWLRRHMHLAEGRRALIHCDVGCHNMLAHDGELSGLLDWETVAIGNPAHDLAYVNPLAEQMVAWDAFLAEYVRAGGVAPTTEEFDFYRVWTATWRLSVTFIAQSFLDAGYSDHLVHTYAALHISNQCNLRLQRLMAEISERYG